MAKQAQHRKLKVKGDASLTITVNLPHDHFEAHAKRVLRLLDQGGYEAYAMSSQWILDQADQIRALQSS